MFILHRDISGKRGHRGTSITSASITRADKVPASQWQSSSMFVSFVAHTCSHGCRKRGYAGDLTPQCGDIDMYNKHCNHHMDPTQPEPAEQIQRET